jgi:quercetin dioxygenase-like cupin family protein
VTETRLAARLADEGLQPQSWSNGPAERYAAHRHDYDKVIVVTDGSIEFGLVADGAGERRETPIHLASGDRLELPAGTVHRADVGPGGVTCLEAHRPAGTLAPGPRCRSAGDW